MDEPDVFFLFVTGNFCKFVILFKVKFKLSGGLYNE